MHKKEKIINYISKLIIEGKIKEKDLIPSENALAKLFNISRVTVRLALSELVHSKILIPRKGLGYIYNGNDNNLNSFKEKYGSDYSSVHIKTIHHSTFNTDLMTHSWYEIRKVRYYKNKPFIYTIQKISNSIIEKIGLENAEKSFYNSLNNSHVDFAFAKKTIKLIKIPLEIKKIFHIEKPEIVFLKSITYDYNDHCIEVSHNYYLSDFEWDFIEYRSLK